MTEHKYDVCLSYASEQKSFVDEVARLLEEAGVRVFYDRSEPQKLWGKDLYAHLDSVYRGEAKYCIIFVSKEYAKKFWPSHERRSAQAHALENDEYILPARFDNTEIPGLPPTVAYIDLSQTAPEKLAEMFIAKLRDTPTKDDQSISSPSTSGLGHQKKSRLPILIMAISAVVFCVITSTIQVKTRIHGHASGIPTNSSATSRTQIPNSTTKTAATAPEVSSGPLLATATYLQSNVGMFSSVLPLSNADKTASFLKRRNEGDSSSWITALNEDMTEGAYVLGGADVSVELKNPSPNKVVIHDIRVAALKRESVVTGVLFFVQPQGGDRTQLGFDLDSPTPEAKVVNQQDLSLGKPFFTEKTIELSPQETESLTLRLSAGEAAYSFQIAIDYNDGQVRSSIVKNVKNEPYTIRTTAALCKNPAALNGQPREFLPGAYGKIFHPVLNTSANYSFQPLDPATFMQNNCNDI